MSKLSEWKTVQEALSKSGFRQYGPIQLHESAGRMTYQATGVFQNFIEQNLNGRRYGKKLWEKNLALDSDFSKMLAERGVLGMIEHPEDGMTKMAEASHVVTKVWIATESEIAESKGELREGDVMGTLEVLPTPQGNLLRSLIEARVRWGVSSRGSGTTTQVEGFLDVNEDFLLETWDVVFTPSVQRAIPKLIQEVAAGRVPNIPNPETQIESVVDRILVSVTSDIFGKLSLIEGKDGKVKFTGNAQLAFGEFDSISCALGRLEEAAAVIQPKPKVTEAAPPTPPAPAAPPVPTPAPKPHTKAMSKLIEARKLKTEAIRLAQTDLKTLKVSDKAALLESIDTMRVEAAALMREDPDVRLLIEDANSRLTAFATRLDENEAPPPPAPPAAGAGGPPAPPAPGGEEDEGAGDEEGSATADLLIKAADMLRSAAEGGVEPEAALGLADELEANADGVATDPVDYDAPGAPEDGPFEEIPAPESLPEAKRAIGKLQRRLQINENRTKRLNAATETLIAEHKTLKESSQKRSGEGGDLFEQAAKKLAAKYNKDMCEVGRQLFKQVKPELYEAHKAELEAIKIYTKLEEASDRIVKAAAPKLNENAPNPPAPPTPPAPPAPPAGDLNESVSMLGRLRGKK